MPSSKKLATLPFACGSSSDDETSTNTNSQRCDNCDSSNGHTVVRGKNENEEEKGEGVLIEAVLHGPKTSSSGQQATNEDSNATTKERTSVERTEDFRPLKYRSNSFREFESMDQKLRRSFSLSDVRKPDTPSAEEVFARCTPASPTPDNKHQHHHNDNTDHVNDIDDIDILPRRLEIPEEEEQPAGSSDQEEEAQEDRPAPGQDVSAEQCPYHADVSSMSNEDRRKRASVRQKSGCRTPRGLSSSSSQWTRRTCAGRPALPTYRLPVKGLRSFSRGGIRGGRRASRGGKDFFGKQQHHRPIPGFDASRHTYGGLGGDGSFMSAGEPPMFTLNLRHQQNPNAAMVNHTEWEMLPSQYFYHEGPATFPVNQSMYYAFPGGTRGRGCHDAGGVVANGMRRGRGAFVSIGRGAASNRGTRGAFRSRGKSCRGGGTNCQFTGREMSGPQSTFPGAYPTFLKHAVFPSSPANNRNSRFLKSPGNSRNPTNTRFTGCRSRQSWEDGLEDDIDRQQDGQWEAGAHALRSPASRNKHRHDSISSSPTTTTSASATDCHRSAPSTSTADTNNLQVTSPQPPRHQKPPRHRSESRLPSENYDRDSGENTAPSDIICRCHVRTAADNPKSAEASQTQRTDVTPKRRSRNQSESPLQQCCGDCGGGNVTDPEARLHGESKDSSQVGPSKPAVPQRGDGMLDAQQKQTLQEVSPLPPLPRTPKGPHGDFKSISTAGSGRKQSIRKHPDQREKNAFGGENGFPGSHPHFWQEHKTEAQNIVKVTPSRHCHQDERGFRAGFYSARPWYNKYGEERAPNDFPVYTSPQQNRYQVYGMHRQSPNAAATMREGRRKIQGNGDSVAGCENHYRSRRFAVSSDDFISNSNFAATCVDEPLQVRGHHWKKTSRVTQPHSDVRAPSQTILHAEDNQKKTKGSKPHYVYYMNGQSDNTPSPLRQGKQRPGQYRVDANTYSHPDIILTAVNDKASHTDQGLQFQTQNLQLTEQPSPRRAVVIQQGDHFTGFHQSSPVIHQEPAFYPRDVPPSDVQLQASQGFRTDVQYMMTQLNLQPQFTSEQQQQQQLTGGGFTPQACEPAGDNSNLWDSNTSVFLPPSPANTVANTGGGGGVLKSQAGQQLGSVHTNPGEVATQVQFISSGPQVSTYIPTAFGPVQSSASIPYGFQALENTNITNPYLQPSSGGGSFPSQTDNTLTGQPSSMFFPQASTPFLPMAPSALPSSTPFYPHNSNMGFVPQSNIQFPQGNVFQYPSPPNLVPVDSQQQQLQLKLQGQAGAEDLTATVFQPGMITATFPSFSDQQTLQDLNLEEQQKPLVRHPGGFAGNQPMVQFPRTDVLVVPPALSSGALLFPPQQIGFCTDSRS